MNTAPSRRSVLTALTAVPVLALSLAACGSSGTTSGAVDTPAASADPGSPTPGGTLRLAVGTDAGCVDPQQVGSNDSIYSVRHLVDSLTDQDPQTGQIVPWLASEWDVDDDATTFTFTLVEGATFSDGTPVDAAAVKANLDAIADLGARGSVAGSYLVGYQGTEVVDPQTAVVSFEHPNAQFLQATSTHFLGLVAPASTELSPDERCAGIIGSGPFTLGNYSPNSSIQLDKREDYDWGSSLWQHEGAAYLDAVEVTIVPESGVRLGSLQSGQVDLIGNIAAQDEAPLTAAGAQLLARPNPGVPFGLSINHDTEVLADPAVRRAISLAINRQEIVDTVFTSFTVPATSILASTTPLYASQAEALAFDPAAAEETLAEAGYERGADGIWAKGDQRVSFEILWFANAATNAPALELLQQQLAAAGIEATLREGQVAEWGQLLADGDYEANWSNVTRADADILRTSFSTELANNFRLEPSELDELLTTQAGEADPGVRGEVAAQAQEYIVDNLLTIPVVELTTVLAAGAGTHGVAFDAGSRIQLFDAWVER